MISRYDIFLLDEQDRLFYSELDLLQAFFGVFDGHGGRAAVDYVSKNLGKNIVAALEDLEQKGNGDPETAIVRGYLATDEGFLSQVRIVESSTHPDAENYEIIR